MLHAIKFLLRKEMQNQVILSQFEGKPQCKITPLNKNKTILCTLYGFFVTLRHKGAKILALDKNKLKTSFICFCAHLFISLNKLQCTRHKK